MLAQRGPPPTILLAGFAPSADAPDDPSAALAVALARDKPGGATCVAAILPALWCGAQQALDEAIARERPDAVVMLGFCDAAAGFHVETCAHNRACPDERDWTGRCWPGLRLAPGGPQWLRVPLAETLHAGLRAVTPLVTVADGGASDVRNGALWSALYRASAPPVGYIAVPRAADSLAAAGAPCATTLTRSGILHAVRHALACLAAQTGAPSSSSLASHSIASHSIASRSPASSPAPSNANGVSALARMRAETSEPARVGATA